MQSDIPWSPQIILKRHPRPQWPASECAATVARRLYLSIICARPPKDRSLAAIFDIPFDQIEADRRLFGELQSYQRHLAITLRGVKCDDTMYVRHRSVHAGIELFLLIMFGIEPSLHMVSMKAGFQAAVGESVEMWELGRLGDPDSSLAIAAVIIALGDASLTHRIPWRWVDRTYWHTQDMHGIRIMKVIDEMAQIDQMSALRP